MPHISIHMYPGRSEEEKKELAEKIRDFAAKEMDRKKESFVISMKDIPAEEWDASIDEIPEEEVYIRYEK